MKDNAPHKPRPLYSAMPLVLLVLFFGAGITLWSKHHVIAIVVFLVGIVIYWVWAKARTKLMHEEQTMRRHAEDWDSR